MVDKQFYAMAGLRKCAEMLQLGTPDQVYLGEDAFSSAADYIYSPQIHTHLQIPLSRRTEYTPGMLRFGFLFQLYQTLYAWFMLLYGAEAHHTFMGWHAGYDLFIVDAIKPAVHTQIAVSVETSQVLPQHILLPYITHLVTNPTRSAEPIPLEQFYAKNIKALDNLWVVANIVNARDTSALMQLHRAMHDTQ